MSKWTSCAPFGASLSGIVVAFLIAAPSQAAIESRAILKTYFQTGDVPTQEQFGTLIDSMVNYIDDRYLLGLKVYNPTVVYNAGDTVIAKRFGIGDTAPADPTQYVDPHGLVLDMATDFAGQYAFLGIRLGDSTGQSYYGYLQLGMDTIGAPFPPGPGIHVDYVAFETTPDTAAPVAYVPEPTGAGMVMGCVMIVLSRRRRRLD